MKLKISMKIKDISNMLQKPDKEENNQKKKKKTKM